MHQAAFPAQTLSLSLDQCAPREMSPPAKLRPPLSDAEEQGLMLREGLTFLCVLQWLHISTPDTTPHGSCNNFPKASIRSGIRKLPYKVFYTLQILGYKEYFRLCGSGSPYCNYSALPWKQPSTCKWYAARLASNRTLFTKNRWQAGFGPWAVVCLSFVPLFKTL